MRRIALTVLAVLAPLGALSACGSDGDTTATSDGGAAQAATKKDIVIGLAMAKTGFVSFYDEAVKNGIKLKAEEINAAGGIDGSKIRVVEADSRSDINQSAPAVEKVISKGAQIVVTSSDANFGGPGARVANDKGLLTVGVAGGSTYGLQGIGKLVFNAHSGNATEGSATVDAAVAQGWKKPYLLEDTSIDYSKQLCKIFRDGYPKLSGSTIAGSDTFVQTDKSIASQVTRLKNAVDAGKVDVVVLCSYPPGGASAIRQIRAAGVDLPILTYAGFDGAFWTKAVPKVSDVYHTAIGSMYGDDPRPTVNKFFESYKAKYGEPPIAYPLLGYAEMETIADALKANGGDTDGAKLAQKLEAAGALNLVLGPTTYSASCHAPLGRGMPLMKWTNGKDKFVSFIEPKDTPQVGC